MNKKNGNIFRTSTTIKYKNLTDILMLTKIFVKYMELKITF